MYSRMCIYQYVYIYIEICETKKKSQKSKGIYINLSRHSIQYMYVNIV